MGGKMDQNAIYYKGARPDLSALYGPVAANMLDALLQAEANHWPSVGGQLLFKYAGPANVVALPFSLMRSGEDWFLGGFKFAIGQVLTAVASDWIFHGIASALAKGTMIAAGWGAVGPVATAGGVALLWSNFVWPRVENQINLLFGTQPAELVLHSPSGTILGGALYPNGIPTNAVSEAAQLVRVALSSDIPDPTPGAYIEYLLQSNINTTFSVKAGDILKAIAEPVGENTDPGQWGPAYFAVRYIECDRNARGSNNA
ncbi:hypothetical protein WCLP8_4830004 [uncultured Gammaproteobacteria bacterium]